jgi:hypothetical protein
MCVFENARKIEWDWKNKFIYRNNTQGADDRNFFDFKN